MAGSSAFLEGRVGAGDEEGVWLGSTVVSGRVGGWWPGAPQTAPQLPLPSELGESFCAEPGVPR